MVAEFVREVLNLLKRFHSVHVFRHDKDERTTGVSGNSITPHDSANR